MAYLPHEDPFPVVRAAKLAHRRTRRAYDYPAGIAMLRALERADEPSAFYMMRIAESNSRVLSHHASFTLRKHDDRRSAAWSLTRTTTKILVGSVLDFWD